MKLITPAVVGAALCLVGGAAASQSQTLRLTEKQTFEHNVDRGAKGESNGDVRDFGGTIYRSGKRVGHDRIHCVLGTGCTAVMWLPGGTLRSDRFAPATTRRFSVGIESGTGVYRKAAGRVDVTAREAGSRYVVHLRA